MAHVVANKQETIRLRSEKVGWELVECVGGRRKKGRGMGDLGYKSEEKDNKISIRKIQIIPE